MLVDLATLYLIATGTLLASLGLTLWELRTHPRRRKELALLAAAYFLLALGCAEAIARLDLPGMLGSALSNITIFCGYLLILWGVAAFNRRRKHVVSLFLLACTVFSWVLGTLTSQVLIWEYFSALPIAAASGLTAWELWHSDWIKSLHSRRVVMSVAAIHCVLYAFRGLLLPVFVHWFGPKFLNTTGLITLYEGVLYSVVLPMSILRLVREEAHEQLLQETRTDYLTGLRNRRAFFEEAERLMQRVGHKRPLALLAFDLDHFKTINDRYGHEHGDEVLKSFAQTVVSVLGPSAIVARMGGEEFVALLPDHGGFSARVTGESLVQRFADTPIVHRRHNSQIRSTVSAGLALHGQGDWSLIELMAAADTALYVAKSKGGNCIETYANDPRVKAIVAANTLERIDSL